MSRRRPRLATPCHTPWKGIFTNRATATSAAAHVTAGGPLWPYRCSCGWWHLTSHPRQEQTA